MTLSYCSYCSREFDDEEEFWDHAARCERQALEAARVGLGWDTWDEAHEGEEEI